MKFSIRELLAVTLLVVLGMLVWRASRDARRDESRLTRLRSEIEALEAQLRLDDPTLHQVILNRRDEFMSLRSTRQRAVEHFELLRAKYSTMQQPEPGVLAIRGVPSLAAGSGRSPTTFGLWLPAEREVWLQFGVHQEKHGSRRFQTPEERKGLLTDSPFDHSGPFERRLPPGRHTLSITTGPAGDEGMPVVIQWDGDELLRSTFVTDDMSGGSGSWISGRSQLEFGRDEAMPWLMTQHFDPSHEPGNPPPATYGFSVWLSDESSGFADFPGEARADDGPAADGAKQ